MRGTKPGESPAVSRKCLGTLSLSLADPATNFQTAGYASAHPNEIFVYVHGWNLSDFKKTAWAETVFKRLWWQGFQSRFVAFQWPCLTWSPFPGVITYPHNYDDSELLAWQSGKALANLLQSLNGSGVKLGVLAHSQGNVVAAEAVRLYSGPPIAAYIATQAAVSPDIWAAGVDDDADSGNFWWHGIWIGYASLPETPDIYAYFDCGSAGPDGHPYLEGHASIGNKTNFFNQDDYALSSPGWAYNNATKPDGGPTRYFGYEDNDGNGLDTYTETDENGNPVDQFYRKPPLADRDVQKIGEADLPDRFRIFAYCAESRNKAMGRVSAISEFTPFDLSSGPLNYDYQHYCHSREFRSNIVDEWAYWKKVMEFVGYTQDMWPDPQQ